MARYLFGPVSRQFAEDNLQPQRQAGYCLAFDDSGDNDLTISPTDSWAGLAARWPSGWQPDFIALYLPYRTIPPALWSAPFSLIGLTADISIGVRHRHGFSLQL